MDSVGKGGDGLIFWCKIRRCRMFVVIVPEQIQASIPVLSLIDI